MVRTGAAAAVIACLGCAFGLSTTSAWAQTPVLVNVNPYSATAADANPSGFAVISTPAGERVVFAANDGINGSELWITDGTTAGTTLLADINPAAGTGSSPQSFIPFGTRVLFSADNGTLGRELWITDGTTTGTTLVRDIRAASTASPSFSSDIGVVGSFGTPGSYVVFGANDGVNGAEPWVTDGTPGGTNLLLNISTSVTSTSSNASGFFTIGTRTYFLANDQGAFGNELWATDGTTAGTSRVTDFEPGAASSGMSLDASLGDFGYGVATTTVTGQEPVAINLTTNAVIPLGDLRTGTSGSSAQDWAVLGSSVLFRASTLSADNQLYSVAFDALGVPTGATVVSEINATGNDNVAGLTTFGGFVYFAATDGVNGRELWRTDGTSAGTTLVADINPGSGDSTPLGLVVAGGKLYFTASTPAFGRELYVSDGTASGTVRLADLRAGVANGLATSPAYGELGGRLLFAGSGTTIGNEPFSTDGTIGGTTLIRDIRTNVNAGSVPQSLTAVGPRLFFTATDEASGRELWTIDGSTPSLVADINPGSSNSSPYGLTPLGSSLIMAANAGTSAGQTGIEYYSASATGATLLADINPGTGSSAPGAINNLGALGGNVYFQATDGVNGFELWRSDGVSAPTLAADINPNAGGGSAPSNFATLGSTLYFSAGFTSGAGAQGFELYRFDGTTASIVENFNTGTSSASPAALFPFNGRLFMRATPPSVGSELVVFDPTLSTPDMLLVQDIRTGSASSTPSNFLDLSGQLLFTATDGSGSIQLYTATHVPGSASVKSAAIGSTATTLVKSGNFAYFAAGSGVGTNVELWAYDGVQNSGNAFVIEINPSAGSFPTDLTDVDGRLYFAAVGPTGGNELYRVTFDAMGVPNGAELVADLNPAGSSTPRNFRVVGSRLYFAADDGLNGEELWYLDLAPANVVCCRGSTCAVIPGADCTVPAGPVVGVAVSPASSCAVQNSATAGCCVADFNKLGGVTIDDIFIYLNAWFASSDFANVGAPGTPNIDDIFIFLNAWFAGC
jgi:ELWxxDGT repeat protein